MSSVKTYRLIDLVEDISKVDAMIKLHSEVDKSDFMISQYKAKKEKLFGYLVDELASPPIRSQRSFWLIKRALEKFYPEISKDSGQKGKNDLSELEAVLV